MAGRKQKERAKEQQLGKGSNTKKANSEERRKDEESHTRNAHTTPNKERGRESSVKEDREARNSPPTGTGLDKGRPPIDNGRGEEQRQKPAPTRKGRKIHAFASKRGRAPKPWPEVRRGRR